MSGGGVGGGGWRGTFRRQKLWQAGSTDLSATTTTKRTKPTLTGSKLWRARSTGYPRARQVDHAQCMQTVRSEADGDLSHSAQY